MSIAHKCDICGKLYEASLPYPDLRLYQGQSPHIDQLDLCDECQEKLKRFVNGDKEVEHGKWSRQGFMIDEYGDRHLGYVCSVCKKFVPNKGNYCLECGAKMDG